MTTSTRLPSVRTLRTVFGDNAKQARAILEMSRSGMDKLPMCLLDELAGTHGVESFQVRGDWCEYLNTGDTYAATLILFRGRYRVTSWGDLIEREGV